MTSIEKIYAKVLATNESLAAVQLALTRADTGSAHHVGSDQSPRIPPQRHGSLYGGVARVVNATTYYYVLLLATTYYCLLLLAAVYYCLLLLTAAHYCALLPTAAYYC